MRFRICVLVIAGLMIYFSAPAQKKWGFSSINYAGMLEGEGNTSFQVQTINGIRYKTWNAAIGTGLDYYFIRSIPLFASVNKFFSIGKGSFYLNHDIGMNFPWEKKYYNGFQGTSEFIPGIYWGGGLGYRFRFNQKQTGLLLYLGYSYKDYSDETEWEVPCMQPTPCPRYKERYDYKLKRISIKAGWMF
jgi:hypothetical protein